MRPLWSPDGRWLLLPDICQKLEYTTRCEVYRFDLLAGTLEPMLFMDAVDFWDQLRRWVIYGEVRGPQLVYQVNTPAFLPPLQWPLAPYPLIGLGIGAIGLGVIIHPRRFVKKAQR
jgi:hypothetical protein